MKDLNAMSFDALVPSTSKYLAKNDVGEDGRNLTVRGFKREMIDGDDGSEEKTILYFAETDVKPMVLNKTNASRLAIATGAATAGEARGKVINVFCDPMIEFGGKIVGGLRIRKATGTAAAPKADTFNDDIPF